MTTNLKEFLRFAEDIRLEKQTNTTENSATQLSGLMVLNNICHLIEQLHSLKIENHRLRAHIDLVEHLDKYMSKGSVPENYEDDEKSSTLSVTNSFRNRSNSPRMSDRDENLVSHATPEPDSKRPFSKKVRKTLHLSLKQNKPASPPLVPSAAMAQHSDRLIPLINVSVESDDEVFHQSKVSTGSFKQKRNNERDEELQSATQRSNQNAKTENDDEEPGLKRKTSKIDRYRQKLRSKIDNVKRQFSDQNSTSGLRSPTLNRDEILSAKLAPALTKSYQEKMRQWANLQRTDFLVNYRRHSINNCENKSIKPVQQTNKSTDFNSTNNSVRFIPTISPIQRSLIVYQWRQIMSEEISLRNLSSFIDQKLAELKQLESNLKQLKSEIFSLKHEDNQSDKLYQPFRRSYSADSFITMPSSWLLAVQSAAYSDVLDGTTLTTGERMSLWKKNFFNQLNELEKSRTLFNENFISDFSRIHQQRAKVSSTKNEKNQRMSFKEQSLQKCPSVDSIKIAQPSKPLGSSKIQPADQEHSDHTDKFKIQQVTTIATVHLPVCQLRQLSSIEDDSDVHFSETEVPVRIYFPSEFSPNLQRKRFEKFQVPLRNTSVTPPMSKLTSPIITRRINQLPLHNQQEQKLIQR